MKRFITIREGSDGVRASVAVIDGGKVTHQSLPDMEALFVAARDKWLDEATDDQVLTMAELVDEWSPDGVLYTAGQYVRYGGELYRVSQAHTSQPLWTPPNAPSNFDKLLPDAFDEWPTWVQPMAGSEYHKGDKVTFEGKHYVSLVDNNSWSPAAYPAGWDIC